MVSSNTEIANLALGHLGISTSIGNMDTEKSAEAKQCRLYYDTILEDLINEIPWSHCKKFATLQLVAGSPSSPVSAEWTYTYRYPQDCLQFMRIVSARLNNDTRQSRVPYTIAADGAGQLIYTNWPTDVSISPQCQYSFKNTNVAQYPPNFVLAFSYALAMRIAPSLTRGDPTGLRATCKAEYAKTLLNAGNANINEEQRPEEPQSEFIRARDYSDQGGVGQSWAPLVDGYIVE